MPRHFLPQSSRLEIISRHLDKIGSVLFCLLLAACSATQTPTKTATLGTVTTENQMLEALNEPGRITFQKRRVATWRVPLSGLLNLKHPAAKAAAIEDRDEDIDLYVYTLHHPTEGTYLVDSGVAKSLRDPESNRDISAIVKRVMNINDLVTSTTTHELVESLGGIDGVFLTHIHLDHIMGLLDVPATVPVFVGPDDAGLTTVTHMATQGSTDRLLANVTALQEWAFGNEQIIDVFDDGSFFAIHAPGHTPGSTAYLANTTEGLHLMIGDITHTAWGWEHSVEPGTYSHDLAGSAASLDYIKDLAARLPDATVHPGHQSLNQN